MATLPTPLKAALGLAAAALDEARKLPETLPQAPAVAVTTAMQVSLRVQQHIAAFAARGEEVISQLRGSSIGAPEWATFDESPDPASAGQPAGSRGVAAFDRVPEGSAGDPGESDTGLAEAPLTGIVPSRFEPAEVGGTESGDNGRVDLGTAAPRQPAKRAAKKAASSAQVAAPAKKATRASKAPVKTAGPAKAAAKPAKAAATPAKPAAKRASARSEPLTAAAKRAKPSAAPNPATMAAEIVHAHEAADQNGSGPARRRGAGSGSE
jgi:hypothetical protein